MLGLIKKKTLKLVKDNFNSSYMDRYFLWFTNRVSVNVLSSSDMEMHSHPWDYMSIVLWGGYKETTLSGTKTYGVGSIIKHKHSEFHSLELIKDKCITLFFASKPKVKSTTFLINGKIVNDLQYQLGQCKTIEQKKALVQAYKNLL